jgi:hypothetical protein
MLNRLKIIVENFRQNNQKQSQDLKQTPPYMSTDCYHYINLLGAIHVVVGEKTELYSLFSMMLCSSGPQYK